MFVFQKPGNNNLHQHIKSEIQVKSNKSYWAKEKTEPNKMRKTKGF